MIFHEEKMTFHEEIVTQTIFMKKTTLTSDSKLQNVYDKFPSVAKIKEGFKFFYRGNVRLDDRHLPKKKTLLLWDPIPLPRHFLLLRPSLPSTMSLFTSCPGAALGRRPMGIRGENFIPA
jgi:hypothetical protein